MPAKAVKLEAGKVVNTLDNFANIGKAVLLQSLGLQKNNHSTVTETVYANDYNTPACAACKYSAYAKSFHPDSQAYKDAAAMCENCPHHTTTATTVSRTIYNNEKNRYGYKPMLKSVAIKLFMLMHFYHPDQFGIISGISYEECAAALDCNVRTIHNNLATLADYGYIDYSKSDSRHFSVCLKDAESYYLPASKGGRGYIVVSFELMREIINIDNLMSLRIHLRELVELDTLNIRGPFTALNKTYREMKLSLPDYCKPCVIRKSVKNAGSIFNITCRESSVRFEIIDCFDCKKRKNELYDTYIRTLRDFITEFNNAVVHVNSDNYVPGEYRSFFDLTDMSFPKDMTGSYCFMHFKDYELEDMAQLAMQYSYDNVLNALSTMYKTYILKEKAVNNPGALLRSIIQASLNKAAA